MPHRIASTCPPIRPLRARSRGRSERPQSSCRDYERRLVVGLVTARERVMKRLYDKEDIARRTCQECGMLLDDAGEYHPYVFCVLRKAGRDPWQEIRTVALQLQLGDPGERPPLIREIHGR